MRAAMAAAEVGDDVFGDDPTVNRLEARVAELLGKEAALFVPSGSMSNLIAVRTHCRPGDELLCEAACHIYQYEQGSYAQFCGVTARTIEGRDGILCAEQFEGLARPDNIHAVRTRLVTLENTHNRGGGSIQPVENCREICDWARRYGLATHLDGARLMNAVVATGVPAAEWAALFDTVSLCFSKGLGAPVGSALSGPRDLIAAARRHRKAFGGGMRQAGVLAAAALYALDHHVDRLAEDHANAQRLAAGVAGIAGLRLASERVDTNMLFFQVNPSRGTAAEFASVLASQGLMVLPTSPNTIRMVAHLDVGVDEVDAALEVLARCAFRRE